MQHNCHDVAIETIWKSQQDKLAPREFFHLAEQKIAANLHRGLFPEARPAPNVAEEKTVKFLAKRRPGGK